MTDPMIRGLLRDARRHGIDLLVHRVAISELYRSSPTDVRCRWAFADFMAAQVVLDHADAAKARAETEASHGR